MPRTDFEDDDFDDDTDEGPGEHDAHLLDDEDDAAADERDVVACPACGKYILATAERCHRCGEYFGREAWLVKRSAKHGLWVVAVILVLIAMFTFLWWG